MSNIRQMRLETDEGVAWITYRIEVHHDYGPNLPNGWRCEVQETIEWIEDDFGKRLKQDDPLYIEALNLWEL